MPTEEEILKSPMTGEEFDKCSRSAHAFWSMNLAGECHPQAGIDPTYHSGLQSGGTVQLRCHECKALIGVVLVAKRLPSQDIAALKTVVAGLPKCEYFVKYHDERGGQETCDAPATKQATEKRGLLKYCDEHADVDAADLPWAETVRSLSDP